MFGFGAAKEPDDREPEKTKPKIKPFAALAPYEKLTVKQSSKGFWYDCIAATEFKIDAGKEKPGVFFATENSFCCFRICDFHSFKMKLKTGPNEDSPVVARYNRLLALPTFPLKCCCFQELEVKSGGKKYHGKVLERPYCYIPNIQVLDHNSKIDYEIRYPTICCNCCPHCCYDECICSNCRVPCVIYTPPEGDEPSQPVGKIVKVGKGCRSCCCCEPASFEIEYPDGASFPSKGRLFGGMVLVEKMFY